jgi:hypothetical protein
MIVLTGMLTTASGATERWGVMQKDERWTADNNPYIITDDLLIPNGTRVAIAGGTRILVGKPTQYVTGIPQADNLDSFTISIQIQGIISCVGTANKPITFEALSPDSAQCTWYGILCDNLLSQNSEIAYTTVTGACNGLTLRRCAPIVRNCVFEYNNVGVQCLDGSVTPIYNCVIAHNFATGIRINGSNPVLCNNIIAYNQANGLWCDGVSKITFEYNCAFGNRDGDLLDCDPRLGIIMKKTAKRKDSTDYMNNLYYAPVFQGSEAESLAIEHDVSLPTDKSRLRDTTLAKAIHGTLTDSTAHRRRTGAYKRYSLSSYSPCIDAGKPGKPFEDDDGTRNDMGVWGGPEASGQTEKK